MRVHSVCAECLVIECSSSVDSLHGVSIKCVYTVLILPLLSADSWCNCLVMSCAASLCTASRDSGEQLLQVTHLAYLCSSDIEVHRVCWHL